MQILDLFSGIGGFSYAFKPIAKTIAYCDSDASCRETLTHLFKKRLLHKAPIFEDVRKINRKTWTLDKMPNMITAGFPCQDLSTASNTRTGLDGQRSGLFFEILRIVDDFNIPIVMMENSNMIVNNGLDRVTQEFEQRGFQLRWMLINASDVGALHKRQRWYAVAFRDTRLFRQIPSKYMTSFRWTIPSHYPRVIPKHSDPNVRKNVMNRCQQLGNSIVPQCAMWAWNVLTRTPSHTKPSKYASDVAIYATRLALSAKLAHPPLNLTINDGTVKYKRDMWATPLHSTFSMHMYRGVTSERCKSVFAVQAFYEQHTRVSGKKTKVFSKYMINPNFVEWLMGYPSNWTE